MPSKDGSRFAEIVGNFFIVMGVALCIFVLVSSFPTLMQTLLEQAGPAK